MYFDDFQVTYSSGGVLEENHYYPFGMLNAQLSTQPTEKPLNNYKYNGKEVQKELNLEWLDYGARFYDAQIGRFSTQDPLAEDYDDLSPYGYCAGDPIKHIDVNGEFIGTLIGTVVGGVTGAYDSYKRGQDVWAATNMANKARIGAVTGAIGGATGGAVGKGLQAANNSTKAVQGAMSKNITKTAQTLTKMGANEKTVGTAVNKITTGMGEAGRNTVKTTNKVSAGTGMATESAIKVGQQEQK